MKPYFFQNDSVSAEIVKIPLTKELGEGASTSGGIQTLQTQLLVHQAKPEICGISLRFNLFMGVRWKSREIIKDFSFTSFF